MRCPFQMRWVLLALGCLQLHCAADWLHYRGPFANGVVAEGGWLVTQGVVREVWRAQVGVGSSSSVVSDGWLFTAGHSGGNEVVRCLSAGNGRERWKFSYPVALDPNLFEGGSRATPTLGKSGLYVLSHEGHVYCLDIATGTVRWKRHLVVDFGAVKPEWGFSGAPLVYGEQVIIDAGGLGASAISLDADSGELRWKSGTDKISYAGPLAVNLEERSTLVFFKAGALIGVEPRTGRELWRHPWKTDYNVHAASPLPIGGDRLMISSGYNAGACMVQISGDKVSEVWRNKNLRCHINSPTVWGEFIFGIDGNTGGGNLVCISSLTGERQWEEKSVKGGALIVAGGKLICVSEKGDLVVAEARGDAFKQILRKPVLKQRTWAQPVLVDGRLYLRDNAGNLVCLAQ